MSAVFVACVEAGHLEKQAAMLCDSVRRWGGRYADGRIVIVQPRSGIGLDPETLAAFRRMDVEYERRALNTEYERIHQANKLFAASWVEEHATEDVVVFLDTDAFFMGEPTQFDLGEADAAVRPTVNSDTVTSTGPGHPNEDWWMRLYELCDAEPGPYVETTVDRQRIRAYFNGGLVVGRREAAIFRRWRDNWRRIFEAGHFPVAGGRVAVGKDQPALAATLAHRPSAVRVLDWEYNYPLGRRHRMTGPPAGAAPDDLVHVHYKGCYGRASLLDYFDTPLPDSERVDWLARSEPPNELASPRLQLKAARARSRRLEGRVRAMRETKEESQQRRKAAAARLATMEGSLWWRLGARLRVPLSRAKADNAGASTEVAGQE